MLSSGLVQLLAFPFTFLQCFPLARRSRQAFLLRLSLASSSVQRSEVMYPYQRMFSSLNVQNP